MKKPSKILYFGKKALAFLLSVLVLSLAVFYVSRLAPGDPLVSYYGDRAEKLTPQERAQAEEKLGLDEPIFTQYVRWAQNALHGDFGISYKYKMPAAEVIASRAGNTLLLGGIGFVLIFTLSLLLGMLCARREGTIFDRAVCKLGTITSCIPEFWLSLLLILIFAIELRVLPSSGAYSIGQQNNIADRAAHLILPLAVVVLGHLWYYAYMIRNRLLDEMRADYVLLAKAKGLTRRAVMLRHCLRNTMPTYLSIMAISVPHVLGGTYIVETVFSYPGLGTLAYESARYKDYNLLMLLSLLSGALVILCSIIAQTINEQIDPRIRATVTSTMYDMSRVSANGYFDAMTPDDRQALRVRLNEQRLKDYRSGVGERDGGVVDPVPEDAPLFVRQYHDYYKTSRGYHHRSPNSNDGLLRTNALAFVNMPLLAYIGEIRSAVLMLHGSEAHSRHFSEDAFKRLKGDNKHLVIIPGACHVDLYDNLKVIPFDRIASFYREAFDQPAVQEQ